MKAIRIHGRGGPDHLVYEDAPQPHPGPGEVLVRIHATGVIATELEWDETYQTATGSPRTLPIPGRDLSGVVEEIGQGVTTFAPGAEVYAMLGYGRDGAEADYTIALPDELAPKPHALDHVQAAAVPLSALTAWLALFEHARLEAGQTALIHGGAGGGGGFFLLQAPSAGRHDTRAPTLPYSTSLHQLGARAVTGKFAARIQYMAHPIHNVFH